MTQQTKSVLFFIPNYREQNFAMRGDSMSEDKSVYDKRVVTDPIIGRDATCYQLVTRGTAKLRRTVDMDYAMHSTVNSY